MDAHRTLFNQMVSEHVDKIRYLHSFGEGSCFGMIYITEDDEAYGVGYNGDFNLLCPSGENFLKKRLEKPIKISGLCGKGIKKVCIGDHKGVALGAHGLMYQWGLPYSKIRSSYDRSSIKLPHAMTFMPYTILRVGCGGGFIGVITTNRKVFMWGYVDWSAPYSDGRLFSPMHKEVEAIACGAWHMSMLTTDGKIYTFGHGGYGQLGYDWCEDYGFWRVHKICCSQRCTTIAAGSVSTLFITESGELWACGLNHPQFGRLGVESEESTIKEPVRIRISEPLSEVSVSYTLCNLRNVYGARSKHGSKVYAWGWGFESKVPQIYEGSTSLYDVFHYIASPCSADDHFKLREYGKSDTPVQPETDNSSNTQNNEPVKSFHCMREKVDLVLPKLNLKNRTTLSEPKLNSHRLNNLKPTNDLDKKVHCVEKNTFPITILKKFPPVVCNIGAYKSYLDYVYSGGTKNVEFGELIEIHLLAVHYGETQLIEHTLDQIKNGVNQQNFPFLLEQSKIHQSDALKNLGQTFVKNLCTEPHKVVELIMSLRIDSSSAQR